MDKRADRHFYAKWNEPNQCVIHMWHAQNFSVSSPEKFQGSDRFEKTFHNASSDLAWGECAVMPEDGGVCQSSNRLSVIGMTKEKTVTLVQSNSFVTHRISPCSVRQIALFTYKLLITLLSEAGNSFISLTTIHLWISSFPQQRQAVEKILKTLQPFTAESCFSTLPWTFCSESTTPLWMNTATVVLGALTQPKNALFPLCGEFAIHSLR